MKSKCNDPRCVCMCVCVAGGGGGNNDCPTAHNHIYVYFTCKVSKCWVVHSTAGSRWIHPWAATKTSTRNCPNTRTLRVERHSNPTFIRVSPSMFIFYAVYTPMPTYLIARCKWFPLVKCSILRLDSVTISTIETEPFT